MSRRRIALGVGATMLDRVVGVGLQLALVPILASHWGLERYGAWAMLTAVPGILLLCDLGFASAATVRMTMQIARGERGAARVTMHSASQIVLGAGALILLAGALAASLPGDATVSRLSPLPPGELRAAIASLCAYAALILVDSLVFAVLRSNGRYAVGSLFSTITLVLETALLIAAVTQGVGVAGGASALLAGRAAGLVMALAAAARVPGGVLPGLSQADPAVRRELLGPALAAMAIPLGMAVILQGQVIVLGLAAGAAAVPAFVAARTLSRLGLQVGQALAHPLMPEFGAAAARGNRPAMRRILAGVLAAATAISLVCALVLATAGPWLIEVWTRGRVTASGQLMTVMAASAFCGGIWNPVSSLILAVNRQASFAPLLLALALGGLGLTMVSAAALDNLAAALALAGIDLIMLVVVLRFALTRWIRQADVPDSI